MDGDGEAEESTEGEGVGRGMDVVSVDEGAADMDMVEPSCAASADFASVLGGGCTGC